MNEVTEMEHENGEKKNLVNGNGLVDEMWMKPFEFGWTREVVRRVIVKNGAPTCDIYYYSPGGKKIRSKIEAKSYLTDGLTPECFNFKKKEILGLDSKFETVRDARVRKKGSGKSTKSTSSTNNPKSNKNEIKMTDDSEEESKKEEEGGDLGGRGGGEERMNEEKSDSGRPQRVKRKKVENQKKTEMVKKRFSERIKPSAKRKSVLKKIMEAKQLKRSKSVLPKIKKGASKRKINVSSKKVKKVVGSKLKKEKKSRKTEVKKESASRDLKSIVKKNIGKYREMREKQKLGVMKTQNKKQRVIVSGFVRPRSESIAKNKHFYLKPFEKGWRRELVFRSNSGDKSRQLADVYYFHPNGKKLRSFREISENLTPGLTIDCFTFKKESLECGEPAEVVRNARTFYKN